MRLRLRVVGTKSFFRYACGFASSKPRDLDSAKSSTISGSYESPFMYQKSVENRQRLYCDQWWFHPEHRIGSKVRISLEIESRRQAFIPWSMDLDVQMCRPEYMPVKARQHFPYRIITGNGIRYGSEKVTYQTIMHNGVKNRMSSPPRGRHTTHLLLYAIFLCNRVPDVHRT